MLTQSSSGESFGTILTAAIIAGSAFLLYAFVAGSATNPAPQTAHAQAAVEQSAAAPASGAAS